MNLLQTLRARFHAALVPLADDPAPLLGMILPSQDAAFGDYQANCAMPLAKRLKRAPREVAAQILERLDVADLCDEPEIAGPGFINLRLKDTCIAEHATQAARDPRLAIAPAEHPKTVVVDFSAPNVAKPPHIGHIRSTVIGDALCRTLRFLGHRVIGDNHLGDWGTQFGMIIYGYKHFRDDSAYDAAPVDELARLYRLVNHLIDYHATRARLPEVRDEAAKLEPHLEDARLTLANETSSKKDRKTAQKTLDKGKALSGRVTELEKTIADQDADAELAALATAHSEIGTAVLEETAKSAPGRL